MLNYGSIVEKKFSTIFYLLTFYRTVVFLYNKHLLKVLNTNASIVNLLFIKYVYILFSKNFLNNI